jgi:hypothetical protein
VIKHSNRYSGYPFFGFAVTVNITNPEIKSKCTITYPHFFELPFLFLSPGML